MQLPFKLPIIQRYLMREVLLAVGLVLVAFLALYIFFDFINELNDVGKNGYRIQHAVIFVLLEIPARAYELLPIAALIGSIYALAQLAAHSEFTIMRMSGLSSAMAARMLLLPGLLLVAATVLIGEVVAPRAEQTIQYLRTQTSAHLPKGLRSGIWLKDTYRDPAQAGATAQDKDTGLVRFVNIGELLPNRSIQRVRIYEFDRALRLVTIIQAASGDNPQAGQWRLHHVIETRFDPTMPGLDTVVPESLEGVQSAARQVSLSTAEEKIWPSDLNPELINVLQLAPERMAARNLDAYIHHLEENRQMTERYQIAFWKKVIYPLAVLVMMALALPFAYLHVRSGGISFRIFAGIMIGIAFYLLNNLFSHLGLLNTWPPFLSAAVPSIVALIAAVVALRWVERH